jgi:hypothetical protein
MNLTIPVDKANHFIAGTIIYCLATLFLSPVAALIPVILAGGAKEMYDCWSGKGTPDFNDFLFTLLGAIPVLITHL